MLTEEATRTYVPRSMRGDETTPTVKSRVTLMDLGISALHIEELLFEAQGELTPELEERLDSLLSDGKEAMDSAAWVARKLCAEAEICRAEAQRYRERAEAIDRNADQLKGRMLFALDAAFSGKLKTERNTIWAQTSAATVGFDVAPDADLAKIAETDSMVVRRKFELDKPMLKNLHDAGERIPDGIVVTERPGTRFLRIK